MTTEQGWGLVGVGWVPSRDWGPSPCFGGDAICSSGQVPRVGENIERDNVVNLGVPAAIEAAASSEIFDAFEGIGNNPLFRFGRGWKKMPDGTAERIWRLASGGRWGKGGPKLPWHWHWP